jgi:hypothetical protein
LSAVAEQPLRLPPHRGRDVAEQQYFQYLTTSQRQVFAALLSRSPMLFSSSLGNYPHWLLPLSFVYKTKDDASAVFPALETLCILHARFPSILRCRFGSIFMRKLPCSLIFVSTSDTLSKANCSAVLYLCVFTLLARRQSRATNAMTVQLLSAIPVRRLFRHQYLRAPARREYAAIRVIKSRSTVFLLLSTAFLP